MKKPTTISKESVITGEYREFVPNFVLRPKTQSRVLENAFRLRKTNVRRVRHEGLPPYRRAVPFVTAA